MTLIWPAVRQLLSKCLVDVRTQRTFCSSHNANDESHNLALAIIRNPRRSCPMASPPPRAGVGELKTNDTGWQRWVGDWRSSKLRQPLANIRPVDEHKNRWRT